MRLREAHNLMAGTLATMNVGAWVCFIAMQRHTENEQEGSRNANKSGIPVSTRIRGRYSGDTIVCRVQRHFVCYFLSNNTRCARVSNDMPTLPRIATPVTVLTLVLLMVVFTYLWEFHLL